MADIISPEFIRSLFLFLPLFVLSLTLHEFAHAWVADKLGDSTPRFLGRLTLDPMPHISLFGTIIFPILSLAMNAPLFGWANPVPVDAKNFPKKPFQSMALVAAAGPASNLILAVVLTAILAFLYKDSVTAATLLSRGAPGIQGAAIEMLSLGIHLNLFLAFFNLIPIPPLDGSRIIQGLVKPDTALWIESKANAGQMLLLFLFIFGLLKVLVIPVYLFRNLLFHTFGIL